MFNNAFILTAVLLLFISCKDDKSTEINNTANSSITLLKYAKGFEIQHFKNYKKLIIKSPYQNSTTNLEYILTTSTENNYSLKNSIQTPLKKIVVTSTTHIPMLELLNAEDCLIAFPSTDLIASNRTRKLIDLGKIKELGNEINMNTEILLSLNPDALIGFSVNNDNKIYTTIRKMGIPVIYNGEWLEKTPLGRAEWIKFFGVLFDKEKEADNIFNTIEQQYLDAKKLAESTKSKPTILSGSNYNNVWYLPAGDSFEAQFLKDANATYLWENTSGKGSLALNIENVFEKGNNADIWLSPGFYKTKFDLENADKMYTKFKPFITNNIYSFSNTLGAKGGVTYFELAPTRPDLVLKDLIKITHPEILKNYKLTFYKKLK